MKSSGTYELLDSGNGRKLERVGDILLERQCAVAFWQPKLSPGEWKNVHACHQRSEKGGGHWDFRKKIPTEWLIEYAGLKLLCKPTSFGHLGFFAEQGREWEWLRRSIGNVCQKRNAQKQAAPKMLNLFGYTGGSSLALAQAGADVTHVDAAKGVVDWSKQNKELNQIVSERVRYIVDDCLVFLKREKRRGNLYDGVLLDPPSFGRGPNKEIFKIEENILDLLAAIRDVLTPDPLLVHFSCHTPGFTPEVLANLLTDTWTQGTPRLEGGEMFVTETARQRKVPSGAFCRRTHPDVTP